MKTPKINSKKLAAALAPLALAGAVMAPIAAASTPPSAPAPAAMQSKVGYSQGFPIENHSNHQIKLINITGDGNFEGRPADGTVLKPGESTRVEVQFRFGSNQEDYAHFQILGDDGKPLGTFTANMRVDFTDTPLAYCATTVGSCTPVAHSNPYDPDQPPWNDHQSTMVLQ